MPSISYPQNPGASPTEAGGAERTKLAYIERIRTKIKRFVVLPPNLQGNPEAEFDIEVLPDGNVLSVKLSRTSGNSAYDNAVERAISRAEPLPLPPDPVMVMDFRKLNLRFSAQ